MATTADIERGASGKALAVLVLAIAVTVFGLGAAFKDVTPAELTFFRLTRGDLPEPPPAGWAALGRHPAYRVRTVAGVAQADAVCRALGAAPDERFGRKLVRGCTDPASRTVVLPALPDDPELAAAIAAHEAAHTWGLGHGPNDMRWTLPDGRRAGALTPEAAALLAAMARGQMRYASR